jgi:hypothetical protein
VRNISPKQAPAHLRGLLNVIKAAEEACKGTKYHWLLRKDDNGYFANITTFQGDGGHPTHASTPTEALMRSLQSFNLRSK